GHGPAYMGSDGAFPLPGWRKLPILRHQIPGSAMRKIVRFAVPMLATIILGAQMPAKIVDPADNYAWLEDVHGEKQLAWVREQNRAALTTLKADPRYQAHYDS